MLRLSLLAIGITINTPVWARAIGITIERTPTGMSRFGVDS